MQTHTRFTLYTSTAITCALGLPAPALASFIFVPPAGVTEYRLMFVTSPITDATSADIAYYNDFVSTAAALSPTLPVTTWKAFVSTPSVSAAANISCGASCDGNVPICLVDGNEVAPSMNALLTGAVLSTIYVAEDESGTGLYDNTAYIWTGSNPDGTAYAGHELGAVYPIEGWASSYWSYTVGYRGAYYNDQTYPFGVIAISGEIGSVPEPMSATLLGVGALATGLARKRRRQRQPSG